MMTRFVDCLTVGVIWGTMGAASAAETLDAAAEALGDQPAMFMGVEIVPNRVPYMVTRDVNVRAGPDTGARRIDGLKAGDRVMAQGRHQGWVAIEREGEPYGFAYFKFLVPFIDGRLDTPVIGDATFAAGRCSYTIEFDGKTRPIGEVFEFSDYTVNLDCVIGDRRLAFDLLAFMTEGPYARGRDSVHQIGLDLLVIAKDFDEVLSAIILYDHGSGVVSFDQLTLEDYEQKPETPSLEVSDVPEALSGAVKLTLSAWNAQVWEELAVALQ